MLAKGFCKLVICAFFATSLPSAAFDYNVPEPNAGGRVGALMPYTRYESVDALLGGGAELRMSTDYDPRNIATQASERSYIALPRAGSYAEWTAVRSGQGVTMRFTLPDATAGTDGLSGSLDIYVNGVKRNVRVYGSVKDRIELSSYWSWQYYDATHTDNASDTYISGGIPCFAFDEVGFIIEGGVSAGDKIRIQSSGANGLEYGVDFLEIEKVTMTECPGNSVSAADYGNDVVRAAEEAARQGKTLYIPEGNYEIGSKWYLPGGVRIVGAGIFHTNITFTSSGAGGGGVVCSGGSELSGIHLNSRLNSRHHQKANYKGLEGGPDGFFAHDLWIQHFECGAWFELGNNIRVVNCRLRDNIADGLNFCRATSNSTVYNCSVRNNGDDGLAMWNHSHECGDEHDNRFCYNTVELDWRAGSIGIFGGNRHRIYNNYICDGVLSAGIRVNTDFPGYGFKNTEWIKFENNYVVNCGTIQDIFGQNLAAVFVRSSNWNGAGDVRNVTFTNTQVYNSQSADIVSVDNVPVANNRLATLPGLPEPDDEEPASGGPLEGISGYDLAVEGLAWKNASGTASLKKGDRVVFTVKIINNSTVDIPSGVVIGLRIDIDGKTNVINNSYNKGLAAGKELRLGVEWTATAGGHTVTAMVDHDNRLPGESDEGNNSRVKKFNVEDMPTAVNRDYTPVTGGCDLYVTDVTYENLSRADGTIQPGDHLRFTAVAVNAGDQATPGNIKHGVQFQVDGKDYNAAPITWCDTYYNSMASHEFQSLTANGGGSSSGTGNGRNYWVAEEGAHNVTAWIDDNTTENGGKGFFVEVNENNNKTTVTLPVIPYNGVEYIGNPDQPDNLDGSTGPEQPQTSVVISIGRTGLATYCCERPLDFSGVKGLKAYIASGTSGSSADGVIKLFVSNVTDVPAGEGILLRGNSGEYEVPFTDDATAAYANWLVGVTEPAYIYAVDGNYKNFILSDGSRGVGFYPVQDGGGTIAANKAYLRLRTSSVAGAKAMTIDFGDGITATDRISVAGSGRQSVYYTLSGLRVTNPLRGLYIRDGRKVVVR